MSTMKLTMQGLYNYDPTLFDRLLLPAGIDRYTAIQTILLRSGDFEVLYADADFMQNMIYVWSRKWYHTFEKWEAAQQLSYDPISNYDRHEEWTDSATSETDSTMTGKVSAYNSNTMVDNNGAISNATAETNGSRQGRAWGNIGVTTSQQMLESEYKIAEWNLYEHIADVFLNEFIIPVY